MPYSDHRADREFELISFFFLDISDGVSLLSYTDERGLCDGCTSLTTLHRWARFFLCLDNVHHYIDWFYMISHPFMRLTQPGDPIRHPPIVPDDTYVEPNMPQYPMAAVAIEEAPVHAFSHAEQPRHAVLLNLRIVAEATETYDVMQDCLRIARGVTVNCNVYVRSRQRRHMEDA
ncbi:hypothetical protein GmHk_09G024990 [Glycine max]|nr:hypothetical protein GmHk_09G024990 [Glycine max]